MKKGKLVIDIIIIIYLSLSLLCITIILCNYDNDHNYDYHYGLLVLGIKNLEGPQRGPLGKNHFHFLFLSLLSLYLLLPAIFPQPTKVLAFNIFKVTCFNPLEPNVVLELELEEDEEEEAERK